MLRTQSTTSSVVCSGRLARLAIVADKYAAVDQLTDEEASTLFEPFMNRNGKYDLDPELTSDLVVAAYLLQQGDLFNLFTRRLILDYNKQLSMLKYQAFFEHIPISSIRKSDFHVNVLSPRYHCTANDT